MSITRRHILAVLTASTLLAMSGMAQSAETVRIGLPTKTYRWGLGVPMIGVRKSDRTAPGEERFYPPEMAFALTAFLKPNSKLRDAAHPAQGPRECTLELIDPVKVPTIGFQPVMTLESDLTTPLAHMWSNTDLSRYRWSGLLRPGEAAERAGLMLLRPYERGKIPVVMVHGLASSDQSPWRMDLRAAPGGAKVLNDSYNAAPASMAAALRSLAALDATRRIAVVGLMAELGDRELAEHARIAELAADLGIELIAVDTELYGVEPVAGIDGALAALGPLRSHDAVLVKGSRVVGLERLAAALID